MKKSVKQQRHAWVCGYAQRDKAKPTRFEKKCNTLGLDSNNLDQCIESTQLRDWAEKIVDLYYLPENLLRAWKLKTIWDVSDGVAHTLSFERSA